MISIEKQIEFWKQSAKEDWVITKELLDKGHIRHGLFFVHLSVEKILKAHVCKTTKDLAPRIHNLLTLSDLASIKLTTEQKEILSKINEFNIEGRYPETLGLTPTGQEAKVYFKDAEGIYQWLINQL